MAIGNERSLSNINYRNCFSTDTKPVSANDGDLLYELDTNILYEYNKGTWYPKTSNQAILTAIQNFSNNTVDTGIATSGADDSLVDDTKEFEEDLFINKTIKITISGVTYYRTILTCIGDTITFATLGDGIEVSAGDTYQIINI